MADSGGAESRAYADDINTLQKSKFYDNHRRVFNALFEATTGAIPEGYGLEYPSIFKSTPKEEAEIKKTEADTYSVLITAEVLSPLEAKLAYATGEDISNVLDADEIKAELERAKELATKQLEVEEAELDQSVQAATATAEGSAEGIQQTVGGTVVPDLDTAISQLDSADFRTDKKKGKKRNCQKGVSCGNSCIARSKTCRKKPTAKQAGLAQQIRTQDATSATSPEQSKSEGVFGSTGHDVDFNPETYAQQAGVSIDEANARINAIEGWAVNDYFDIRKSQIDGSPNDAAQKIEAYLGTAKKYDGQIHRGIRLGSVEEFNQKFGGEGSVFQERALNSWTSDKSIGEMYGTGKASNPVGVVFSVQNKSGASIRNKGVEIEQEVLVGSGARYRIKSINQSSDGANGQRINVELEEV